MLLPSYFLISLRYAQAAQQNSTIRTMISICFFGIFIGTFSLALIISIMQGFEQATYKKMQSIYPHIIIDADGQSLDYEQLSFILNDPQYGIINHAPQQTMQALCNSIEAQTMPMVIQIKGIDPKQEQATTALWTMLLPKNKTQHLNDILIDQQVMIGKQLAQQLNLQIGSQIQLIYTNDEAMTRAIDFQQTTVIVSGIFDTGIDDFDAHTIYCSSDLFNQLFPDQGITQIYAQRSAQSNEDTIIKQLQLRLNLNVYSWKKLYSSLVAALTLEKYAMFLILLLIIVVASSNIISLLFMLITQKRKDIALLLTLGLSLSKIKNIFLALSMAIAATASCIGLIVAYGTGLFLQNYRWIQLPDNIYDTTHLPVLLDKYLFLSIFFVVLTISFFASLLPLHKIKMKNIATILRNET